MASKNGLVIAFDVYGTLLDTSSIAEKLSKRLDIDNDTARELATLWRKYQLEYTWRLNSMNEYITFSAVVRRALRQAAEELCIWFSQSDEDAFMEAFNALGVFPDVPDGLRALASASDEDVTGVIFSNGTRDMIEGSLSGSGELVLHRQVFKHVVVVDDVRRYKPAPDVYRHLLAEVGRLGCARDVWLVSGNMFDIVGAKAMGLKAVWVNRTGRWEWTDRLDDGDSRRPTMHVGGVDEAVARILDIIRS